MDEVEKEIERLERKILYSYIQDDIIETASDKNLDSHMEIAMKYEEYEICNKIKKEKEKRKKNL